MLFVPIPYVLNAIYWTVFYKFYPKDAASARTLRVHRAGQVLIHAARSGSPRDHRARRRGGLYATLLAEDKVPGMRLAAICDVLPEKKEAADAYGVPFYADYAEMVTSGQVDAIVTTVPHYLHPEMGIYALDHGVRPRREAHRGLHQAGLGAHRRRGHQAS